MSILIKGMKMPKTHPLTITIYPNGQVLSETVGSKDIHGEAVSVPPHGRLGDLDELKAKVKKEDSGYELSSFGDGMWTAFQSVYQYIDAAPTIIPAEVET